MLTLPASVVGPIVPNPLPPIPTPVPEQNSQREIEGEKGDDDGEVGVGFAKVEKSLADFLLVLIWPT